MSTSTYREDKWWTMDPPKVDGWYWYKSKDRRLKRGNIPSIMYIVITEEDGICTWEYDDFSECEELVPFKVDPQNDMWQGPLKPKGSKTIPVSLDD